MPPSPFVFTRHLLNQQHHLDTFSASSATLVSPDLIRRCRLRFVGARCSSSLSAHSSSGPSFRLLNLQAHRSFTVHYLLHQSHSCRTKPVSSSASEVPGPSITLQHGVIQPTLSPTTWCWLEHKQKEPRSESLCRKLRSCLNNMHLTSSPSPPLPTANASLPRNSFHAASSKKHPQHLVHHLAQHFHRLRA